MHDVLVGSTLLVSFAAGVVALFAPCCISVMLPAYFANSFRRRRQLVAMTGVFALGIATVILPIAFGASGISRLILGHHTVVFMTGAVMMLVLGIATLTGRHIPFPSVGASARRREGPGAVFVLGALSGTASACCAPVLAGVVALSGVASSFPVALAVGVAYVFGMVAPLFVLALLWDRYDWGNSALLKGRTVTVARRPIQIATLVSGLLLIAMSILTAVLAVTGPSMPTSGWQVTLTSRLQHYANNVTTALSSIPGWVFLLALVATLGFLGARALGQLDEDDADEDDADADDTDADDTVPSPPTPTEDERVHT